MKNIFTFCIPLFILLLFPRVGFAQPGALDPTFATNGILTLHTNFTDEKSEDVAIMNNGKILAATLSYPNNKLTLFQADGTVDSSFGTNGVLIILEFEYATVTAIAVDASNRILVMSQSNDYYMQGVDIYRFLADGSPDLTFGDNGEAETEFEVSNNALLIQPDGKIVVAGRHDTQSSSKARVQRFNEDGTIDLSFNQTGYITFNYGSESNAYALALDSSNRLLVTGLSEDNLFLTRLLVDGTPDNTFSGDGHAIIDNGGNEAGEYVAVMPDGKIIVTGFSEDSFTSSANCWRFLDTGSADNSFGDNGLGKVDSGSFFNFGWFLFPNADSSVIVGGSVYNGRTNDPVLYRLLNDGSKDVTFGINGISGKTFSSTRYAELNAVRASTGDIIVCGSKVDNGSNQGVLSQFHPTGSVDSSFAVNGTATFPVTDSLDTYHVINDFAILPNGNILCAGNSKFIGMTLFRLSSTGLVDSSFGQNGILVPDGEGYEDYQHIAADSNQIYVVTDCDHWIRDFEPSSEGYTYSTFAVLKLHTDGTVDSSYGIAGIAQPTFPGYSFGLCESVAIQPDGKLLLTGSIYAGFSGTYGTITNAYLIRLNTDGSPDASFGNGGLLVIDFSFRDANPTVGTLSDGKIIFAETSLDSFQVNSVNIALRMLPDGTMDPSFGVNGVFTFPYLPELRDVPLNIQPDNKIIIALFTPTNLAYSLLRLNENGTIDNSFGINGYSDAPYISGFSWIADVQVQSDGKILCGGKTYSSNYFGNVSALRLFSDGTVDPTFGNSGISKCDSATNGISATRMHLQPDGKIVLSGVKFLTDFYMVRLQNDFGLGTENIIPISSLFLYPDPVSDQLTIVNSASQYKEVTITVVNTMGQIILQRGLKLDGGRITIDVKDFSSGVYILTLKTASGMSSARFVKE